MLKEEMLRDGMLKDDMPKGEVLKDRKTGIERLGDKACGRERTEIGIYEREQSGNKACGRERTEIGIYEREQPGNKAYGRERRGGEACDGERIEDGLILTGQMIREYEKYLRANEKSACTIEKYLRDTRTFLYFAMDRPLTKELVVDYKNRLIQSGKYADSSINSMIVSLRGFLRFLGYAECSVKNIRMQEMPFCPEDRSLTMEEYLRLLRAAGKDERLQLIFKVLFSTGIRISELKYFTVEALRRTGRHARIRVSCKKKNREILIPDDLKRELLVYVKKRRIKSGVIFCTRNGKPVDRSNVWRQMKHLCKKANVDESKVFPHNVRKLFARMFYERSHDIAQLACLLGHSSINTTTIYVKTTEREVRVKVDRMVREVLYKKEKAQHNQQNVVLT